MLIMTILIIKSSGYNSFVSNSYLEDENGPALSEAAAANVCTVSIPTVQRVRKRCVEEGLDIAVKSKFSRKGPPQKS